MVCFALLCLGIGLVLVCLGLVLGLVLLLAALVLDEYWLVLV